MKKILSLFLAAAMLLSLAACGASGESEVSSSHGSNSSSSDGGQNAAESSTPEEAVSQASTNSSERTQGSHILIAYFSWADNAILADDVDAVTSPSVISPGNVQQLAGWVQEETGGDLFSIRVTDPYPSDWDDCLARANEERGNNARPELEENVANLDQYDTVFLGYPTGGTVYPWRCSPSWSKMIFPANRYISFARMGQEVCPTAWISLQRRRPMRLFPMIFLTVTRKMLLLHRTIFKAGWLDSVFDGGIEYEKNLICYIYRYDGVCPFCVRNW